MDSTRPITGAVGNAPLSFLRLVFRPKDAKKPAGDLLDEAGEISERPDDDDELVIIVDALFVPLRGGAASPG